MSERRFILTWAAILAGLIACAWLLMRTSYGQTTAPTTAHIDDLTGNTVSVDIPPPRRTPVRPPVTQPVPTITFSVASLAFNQAMKAPQSVTATGPGTLTITEHDNFFPADTGTPSGPGKVTATFTPNNNWATAPSSTSNASFEYGLGTPQHLVALFPLSFTSSTVTPPPSGGANPPGVANEPAVADWAMPPFMADPTVFSVAAFQVGTAGVGSVQFKVDNNVIGSATAMTVNAAVCPLPLFHMACPALAAGTHTLAATAFPVIGKPKTLPTYQFSTGVVTHSITASGTSTASACQAAKTQFGFGDGVTVLLSSGNWTLDAGGLDTKATYVIFAAASGASVTINGWNGASPHHIKIVGCKMSVGIPNISASDPRFLWIDHCTLDHADPLTDTTGFTGWTDARSGGTPGQPWTSGDGMVQTACATDTTITNSANGWLNGLLARNVTITKLGSDAISNNQTSINCTISSLGVPNSGMHPDVGQWNNHKTGVIIYGLTGTALDMAQGISPEDTGARDWAIVNVNLQSNGVGNMLGLGTTLTNF
jgi:hypothetical protein